MNQPAPSLESMQDVGWKYWRQRMKGTELPLHPAFVPIGFYRLDTPAKARREATSYPVAIWICETGKCARVGQSEIVVFDTPAKEEDFSYNTFSRCGRTPISHEAYLYWMEHRSWPPEQVAAAITASEAPRSNTGGQADVVLRESIAELRAEAEKWLKDIGGAVTTQDQADKAADFASRFAEMEKEANEARTAGRKPHLDRAAEVQKLWQPVAEAGGAAKTWAKGLTLAWQQAGRARLLREAADKAAAGQAVALGDLKTKAGTRGRAVAIRSRQEFRVDDYQALFAHFRDDPRFAKHPLVMQACGLMGDADLQNGLAVPGARLENVESVA